MRNIDDFDNLIAHLSASFSQINFCTLTISYTLKDIIESTEFNASKIMKKYKNLI